MLTELPSADYSAGTRKYVVESDATLMLMPASEPPMGGAGLTVRIAVNTKKPHFIAAGRESADSWTVLQG